MKKVSCASCDGVGNHGKDKRGCTIACTICNGSGKTDPSTEDLSKEYPDIHFCDIEYLSSDDSDIDALVKASETNIICIVTNRDNDIVSTRRLNADMDELNDLIEEVSNYDGDWGDYHTLETIIYQKKSYHAIIGNNTVTGNGDVDISTILPKASMCMKEVRDTLREALQDEDINLRDAIINVLNRTKD